MDTSINDKLLDIIYPVIWDFTIGFVPSMDLKKIMNFDSVNLDCIVQTIVHYIKGFQRKNYKRFELYPD